jgi:hypothetical protein
VIDWIAAAIAVRAFGFAQMLQEESFICATGAMS